MTKACFFAALQMPFCISIVNFILKKQLTIQNEIATINPMNFAVTSVRKK